MVKVGTSALTYPRAPYTHTPSYLGDVCVLYNYRTLYKKKIILLSPCFPKPLPRFNLGKWNTQFLDSEIMCVSEVHIRQPLTIIMRKLLAKKWNVSPYGVRVKNTHTFNRVPKLPNPYNPTFLSTSVPIEKLSSHQHPKLSNLVPIWKILQIDLAIRRRIFRTVVAND